MTKMQLEGSPGPRPRTVRTPDGQVLSVPDGWELLPPGDALVTRRVKAAGAFWAVAEKVGRREMSRGIWAPAATIAKAEAQAVAERATPEYARKLAAGRARRDKEQSEYVLEFSRHVLQFLAFHDRHRALAETFAERVAVHATPVGSGTVARTERIPVAERAEAAVIAWLRHQTTAYDHMTIAREKGARREVRRMLAKRSRELLERYRRGEAPADGCPLFLALTRPEPEVVTEAAPPTRLKRPTRPVAVPVDAPPEANASPMPAKGPTAPTTTPATPKTAPPTPSVPADDPEMARRAARQAAIRARLVQPKR